jgi:hypothetical protein
MRYAGTIEHGGYFEQRARRAHRRYQKRQPNEVRDRALSRFTAIKKETEELFDIWIETHQIVPLAQVQHDMHSKAGARS